MSRTLTVPALLALIGVGALAWQTHRWQSATEARQSATRTLRVANADAAELVRLRAAQERTLFGDPPAEDVLTRVSDVLGALGLPATLATDITREADRAVPGSVGLRRRDMRVELRPIAIPDLGRFLALWNADNPAWRVRQMSVRKVNDRRVGPMDYHVSLTCSAEYTDNGATQ